MPSSMFVYACGGEAQIQLNETTFGMERFGLVHGGKGNLLSIWPKGGYRLYESCKSAAHPRIVWRFLYR